MPPEEDPAPGKGVDVRRLSLSIAVATEMICTQSVHGDQNNIRAGSPGRSAADDNKEQDCQYQEDPTSAVMDSQMIPQTLGATGRPKTTGRPIQIPIEKREAFASSTTGRASLFFSSWSASSA